jgi:hypothetical protein
LSLATRVDDNHSLQLEAENSSLAAETADQIGLRVLALVMHYECARVE